MGEINGPKCGVFWVIQEKLFAFPFEEGKYPKRLQSQRQPILTKNCGVLSARKAAENPIIITPEGGCILQKTVRCISISARTLQANS